ncbi:reverse transcriptase domain-containing protein [Tanacetum coccineum]
MDDEPMWAVDRVVAPTPGISITIPEPANEFAIKGNHLTLVKGNQFDGRFKTDPQKHIHKFLGVCDVFKYGETENKAVRLMMFPLSFTGEAKTWLDELNEGTIESWDELQTAFISRFFPPSLFDRILREIQAFFQHKHETLTVLASQNNSDTDKIMARMDAMTMKVDAQYKEIQSCAKCNHCGGNHSTADCKNDDTPMSREEEAKFMQTFRPKFDRLADKQSARPSGSLPSNTQPNPQGNLPKPYQPSQAQNEHNPINFDSDDEDEESSPQPEPQTLKPVKETPTLKPYKPRKEKMEAQYGKFLDMIRAVRINVPLVDVLAGMPNYGKFLKDLITKLWQISQRTCQQQT